MGRKRLEVKTGDRYGKLTIIKEVRPHIKPCGCKQRKFLVQCDCGSDPFEVMLDNLRKCHTTSCGCVQKEKMKKVGSASTKTNEYDLSDDKVGVGYTSKGEKFYFDKEDYKLVKDYCWRKDGTGYLVSRERGTGKNMLLHRLVMNAKDGEVVDHINHDKLNNCKSNLRKCTQGDNVKNTSINKSNTSGVTGIHWNKKISKWQAYIRVNRKQIHLGYFTSKTEAIRVRVHSELEIFGEYAPTYNYFTEDQRKAILDDTMPAEEMVEILKLNRDVEQCV